MLKLLCSLFLLLFVIQSANASYAIDSDTDTVKKTGFLFSFLKYIEFKDKNESVNLCVIGNKKIYAFVKKLSELNTSRKIEPKYYTDSKMEIRECDVVYISENIESLGSKILAIVSGAEKFVLTISDIPNFVEENNGLIEIYKERDIPKFGLNLKKFASENIEVSSKLVESADKLY
jgi:hypothetical protein